MAFIMLNAANCDFFIIIFNDISRLTL